MPNSFPNPASANQKPPTRPPVTYSKREDYFQPGFEFITSDNIDSGLNRIHIANYEQTVSEQYKDIAELSWVDPLNREKHPEWHALIATVTYNNHVHTVGGMLLEHTLLHNSYVAKATNWLNHINFSDYFEEYKEQWADHKQMIGYRRLENAMKRQSLPYPTPKEFERFANMQVCEAARFARVFPDPAKPHGFETAIQDAFKLAAHHIPQQMQARPTPSQMFIYLTDPITALAELAMLKAHGNQYNYFMYPVLERHINYDLISPVKEDYYKTPRVRMLLIPKPFNT